MSYGPDDVCVFTKVRQNDEAFINSVMLKSTSMVETSFFNTIMFKSPVERSLKSTDQQKTLSTCNILFKTDHKGIFV